jgi:transposase-like protein
MDPVPVFCPNLECPARGQTGQGNMGIHSRKAKRFICRQCRKTFTATKGTVCYRLRTAAATVVRVMTWRAPGCPPQAMVAACGMDERTVADGLARAGRPGQAVHEWLVEHRRDLGQVHADALRVKTPGGMVWMALALLTRTRLWLAGEVSAHRDMTLIRRRSARVRRGAAPRPLLGCIDGLHADVRAIRETCRDPVRTGAHGRPRRHAWNNIWMAPVVKRSAQRRVVDVERRRVDGPSARVERLRQRSPGHGVLNTASIERLHATCRERLAALTRRGRALARRPLTRHHGMDLVGTVDHFCTPHKRLCPAGEATPPARAAEMTDHCGTVQAWWSSHVPPPRGMPPKRRGRPSRALHRLVERWCAVTTL